jgi:hypothetical protein
MTAAERQAGAVRVARTVAARYGVHAREARVLMDSNNTVVHLGLLPVAGVAQITGGSPMAFAFLVNPPSMTASQYDDVMRALDAAGAGDPPGRLYHACFGSGDHLRMLDVWESREALDAFVQTLLGLPGEWEGIDPGELEAAELHNMVFGRTPVAV